MSSFDSAILTILEHEGGLANDPRDLGGTTKYGISLRFLKEICADNSTLRIEYDLNADGLIDSDDICLLDKDAAMDIYKTHWWDNYRYQEILHQDIATKIFDLAVNMGPKNAHRCLQRAVRAATGKKIKEDGILGPITLGLTNQANPLALLASLRSEAAGYYRSLKNPHFENGWLNRAYD